MEEKRSSLQTFSRRLVKLGVKYENVVLLSSDMTNLLGLKQFAVAFPERYFNLGLSCENLIGVAAGMSMRGRLPIVCLSAMSVGRVWEQLRNLVCYQNLNVKLVSGFAGVGVGKGGGMKQMFEDIALMRVLPNMKVVVPMDSVECEAVCNQIMNDFGPTYLRLSEVLYPWDSGAVMSFQFGESLVVRGGRDAVVFAMGNMALEMLAVAKILDDEHGIAVSVVNVSSLKPIHEKLIVQQVMKVKRVITVEEHSLVGGLGAAVIEVLNRNDLCRKVHMIGMKDCFGKSSEREELFREYGFDRDSLVSRILEFMN